MIQKYHKITKQETMEWLNKHQKEREEIKKDPNRLHFHIMPEIGWVNDPNGLFEKDGIHHIYYQYCPFNTEGSLKLWGHVTTKDFIHYQNQEIALFPDQEFDKHGVYSGSAFVKDDQIYYFYTGNVKYFDREDYDYINEGRGSNTIVFTSKDGFKFSDKTCLLTTNDYPKTLSNHVRDPKIIEKDGMYYLVLGARDKHSKGCILIYESKDFMHWDRPWIASTKDVFGYMWECPDLFELEDKMVLLCCPQGVETQGIDYTNVHQSAAMIVNCDFKKHTFEVEAIHQFDRGHDFYAQQTYLDEKGRRICIGWMGIPDADYTNPTVKQGWQHALTLARQLTIQNGRVYQTPLEEYKSLRTNKKTGTDNDLNQMHLQLSVYECIFSLKEVKNATFWIRKGVSLTYENKVLTLDLHEYGCNRKPRSVVIDQLEKLHIYSDTTSLEIFVNDGIEVFTSRVYCDGLQPITCNGIYERCTFECYELNKFQFEE